MAAAAAMTELLTLDATASRLHVSKSTVRRLIERNELRSKHVGRRVFVTDREIEIYLAKPDARRWA